MGNRVTTQYRQAEASYYVTGTPNQCIVTLLYYAGAQHNCPPRRFVLSRRSASNSCLADDVCQSLKQVQQQQISADPLFPEKAHRANLVDNLV